MEVKVISDLPEVDSAPMSALILNVDDVEKAYDNVVLEKLKLMLANPDLELGADDLKSIMSILDQYENMDMDIQGHIVKRKKGMPQGMVLATDLFNLYFAEMIKHIHEELEPILWTFADNNIFIGPKKQLKEAYSKVSQALNSYGMQFKGKERKTMELENFTVPDSNEASFYDDSEIINNLSEDTEINYLNNYLAEHSRIQSNNNISTNSLNILEHSETYDINDNKNFDKIRILGYRFTPINGRLYHDVQWLFDIMENTAAHGANPPYIGIDIFRQLIWSRWRYYLELYCVCKDIPDWVIKQVRSYTIQILQKHMLVQNIGYNHTFLLGFDIFNIYTDVRQRLNLPINYDLINRLTTKGNISLLSETYSYETRRKVYEKLLHLMGLKDKYINLLLNNKSLFKYLTTWVRFLKWTPQENLVNPMILNWYKVAQNIGDKRFSLRELIVKTIKGKPMAKTRVSETDASTRWKNQIWIDQKHNFKAMDAIYTWIYTEDKTLLDRTDDDALIHSVNYHH